MRRGRCRKEPAETRYHGRTQQDSQQRDIADAHPVEIPGDTDEESDAAAYERGREK